MATKYATYAAKAVFVDIVDEGSTPDVPATKAQLDSWIKAASEPFHVWHDPPGVGQRVQSELAGREWAFLVDLQTMKVLGKQEGALDQLFAKLDAL